MVILGYQVHPVVQVLFPDSDAIFQEDNSPTHTHTHSQKCSVLFWGAWRCTSPSPVASTVAQPKYHRTTVGSFRKQGDKQIPSIIFQATRRQVAHYSTRDFTIYMNLFQEGYKLCYRQMLAQLHINKEICIFHSCFHYICPSPVHVAKLYSLGWLDYVAMYLCK